MDNIFAKPITDRLVIIHLLIDTIDEVILSSLSKNAKNDTREILENLMDSGYNLTESEIESRITNLEDSGVITGYTISVDLKKIPRRTIRVSLVTFRTSQHLPKRLEGLRKYLADAPFVIFSGKTRGGYDWITIQSFFNEEMADDESDIYRNLFGDIIQSYEIYDFVPMKEFSHQALTHTKREYKKFLDEWIPPFLGK